VFSLKKPTARHVHIAWLVVSAVLAAYVTRGALLVLFLGLFFVIWIVGFGVIVRYYR
jgi:hypothetical protein